MTHGHHAHGKRWVLRWTPPAGIAADARVFGRFVVAASESGAASAGVRAFTPFVAAAGATISTADRPHAAGTLSIGIEEQGRAEPARLEQVHGNRVAVVTGPGVSRATDAAATIVRGLPITVRTADCVPVFVAGPEGVAVIHAGWRGTAAGITGAAVHELVAITGHPAAAFAAFIGPSIGACCYEVGTEVAGAFEAAFLAAGRSGRPRLDLWRANRVQLESSGISPGRILEARICTRCHQHLYHSHRGSGGKKGRIDAVITLGNPD